MDWYLKWRRLRWRNWEQKGGFNIWFKDKQGVSLKSKSRTDLVMVDDLGVEAGMEITSKLAMKRSSIDHDSTSAPKKLKSMNAPADEDDGITCLPGSLIILPMGVEVGLL